MRVMRLGGYNLAISSANDLLETKYKAELVDLSKLSRIGKQLISKAAETKKVVSQPYSMSKLLTLLDTDEYHCGCIDALSMATVMQFECKNSQVKAWMETAEFPACEDQTTILAEMIKFYLASGNGFLIKMRNAQGQWMGLERMLPSEVQIVENYDEFGFFRPDYIQVKNNQKKDFAYADIIHIKKSTHKSNAWGLACLPIAINIEILGEIKTFDYNNFKNGLMIDYFMIVEGGTLRDGTVTDEQGNEVLTDAYTEIEKALVDVKGNAKSHSTVLIESESRDVKIRLEPLRQQDREGGFLSLKKDLREGILAYHRVPARIVSQLIPGQLGGDNKSDMLMFYHFVIKPLQKRLALTLAIEFNYEFGWNVTLDDFNFGNLTEILQSADDQLFMQNRNFGAK
ncbi:MAG: phage portal protein [Candidatus Cloacimonetes bacterium]|nr:phage portal protein [Candidatus Cloacimonadota bacterium]MDD4276915.1 phage portal protein [Candidatus Cloacimonadota bacterium]